jgi:hypothetical protein
MSKSPEQQQREKHMQKQQNKREVGIKGKDKNK